MKTIMLNQGTEEWSRHRLAHFNASDAPAMMGCSPHEIRSHLLERLATGAAPAVNEYTQRVFDRGHRYEALARPLAEDIVGEDLFPVVGTEGKLSASFDGLTIDERIAWEHKMLNKKLREAMVDGCTGADLDLMYRVQMEQQCLVSGATEILFMASEWDHDDRLVDVRHCWYDKDMALRTKIIEGWKQFAEDLANYKPTPETVVAESVDSLPAVSVRMEGSIAIVSNLDLFGERLRAYVADIDKTPKDDQAFADCEAAIKVLKNAEDALKAAEASALAQTASIEEMRRTVGDYGELARSTRLLLEKLVKDKKDTLRLEIKHAADKAFSDHVSTLNKRLVRVVVPPTAPDFARPMKGLKSIASARELVNAALVMAKIAASCEADRIAANLAAYDEAAAGYEFLFRDLQSLALQDSDSMTAIVKQRIADHAASEAKRLDAERERIRVEEQARRHAEPATQVEDMTETVAGECMQIDSCIIRRTAASITKQKPTDAQIIMFIGIHFNISDATAARWILDMDHKQLDGMAEDVK